MSILSAPLPEEVEVVGGKYGLHTDFRLWMDFENMMKKGPPAKKYAGLLKKYYVSLPPTLSEAVYALCRFYAGGTMPQKDKQGGGKRLYSYEQDADMIFCAFYAQYHIDLEKENMHWWKFLALLRGLDENCRFMQIVRLRSMDLNEIKDKNERHRIAGLKRKYSIDEMPGQKIKDNDFADKISMLF